MQFVPFVQLSLCICISSEVDVDLVDGEVNTFEVQQDPNQSSEEPLTDFASEGKPLSISQFITYATTFVMFVLLRFRSCIETLDA
jgi:hypothetical protein